MPQGFGPFANYMRHNLLILVAWLLRIGMAAQAGLHDVATILTGRPGFRYIDHPNGAGVVTGKTLRRMDDAAHNGEFTGLLRNPFAELMRPDAIRKSWAAIGCVPLTRQCLENPQARPPSPHDTCASGSCVRFGRSRATCVAMPPRHWQVVHEMRAGDPMRDLLSLLDDRHQANCESYLSAQHCGTGTLHANVATLATAASTARSSSSSYIRTPLLLGMKRSTS
jgi:hypothetical protein